MSVQKITFVVSVKELELFGKTVSWIWGINTSIYSQTKKYENRYIF